MPTLRDTAAADNEGAVLASRYHCLKCQRPVLWMLTHPDGRPQPFDVDPIPVRYDSERTGWAPGLFPIAGRIRRVMAPRSAFAAARQGGFANVLNLHTCGQEAT